MIPTPHAAVTIAHGTHPGETGKNNEDNYAIEHYYGEGGEPVTLAVICDGIGGNRAGEVASEIAVKTIVASIGRATGGDYAQMLDQAVSQAAHAVNDEAQTRPQLHGMGTTCVAAIIANRRLYTAYVGDSRLYVARRGAIIQATIDHTFVQEALELNLITPAEAKTHPQRHVVRRHIGNDPNVKADFRLRLVPGEAPEHSMRNQGVLLDQGSQALLCSDGLSDLVEPDEILQALGQRDPQGALDDLILLARQRGGHDNITVIVITI